MLCRKKRAQGDWILDDRKFLSGAEVKKLVRTAEQHRDRALRTRRKTPVKDWFLVCVATETGLRVQEIADLRCGDIQSNGRQHFTVVRKGKFGKSRMVHVRKEFIEAAEEYLSWKEAQNEGVCSDAPMFCFAGKAMSKRALQKSYERSRVRAGIRQAHGVGIHSIRHTYASFLLKASRFNLRLVQRQLGHASLRTTEIYAHVFDADTQRAVGKLYG